MALVMICLVYQLCTDSQRTDSQPVSPQLAQCSCAVSALPRGVLAAPTDDDRNRIAGWKSFLQGSLQSTVQALFGVLFGRSHCGTRVVAGPR